MSKQTKILDLDKFGEEADRTITIKGIEYPVQEMSFENFVETTKQAQKLQDDPAATTADHMEASISMIQRTVPTIPAEVLRGLSLVKLGVIVKFLHGELDAELEKTAATAAEAGGAEAKK
jgi:hypothetical protein